jgi:type IV secretory pathway TrbD component
MHNRRAMIVASLIALAVLLAVLVAGWWHAAGFGLAVLVLMDLMVLLRERSARSSKDPEP